MRGRLEPAHQTCVRRVIHSANMVEPHPELSILIVGEEPRLSGDLRYHFAARPPSRIRTHNAILDVMLLRRQCYLEGTKVASALFRARVENRGVVIQRGIRRVACDVTQ